MADIISGSAMRRSLNQAAVNLHHARLGVGRRAVKITWVNRLLLQALAELEPNHPLLTKDFYDYLEYKSAKAYDKYDSYKEIQEEVARSPIPSFLSVKQIEEQQRIKAAQEKAAEEKKKELIERERIAQEKLKELRERKRIAEEKLKVIDEKIKIKAAPYVELIVNGKFNRNSEDFEKIHFARMLRIDKLTIMDVDKYKPYEQCNERYHKGICEYNRKAWENEEYERLALFTADQHKLWLVEEALIENGLLKRLAK